MRQKDMKDAFKSFFYYMPAWCNSQGGVGDEAVPKNTDAHIATGAANELQYFLYGTAFEIRARSKAGQEHFKGAKRCGAPRGAPPTMASKLKAECHSERSEESLWRPAGLKGKILHCVQNGRPKDRRTVPLSSGHSRGFYRMWYDWFWEVLHLVKRGKQAQLVNVCNVAVNTRNCLNNGILSFYLGHIVQYSRRSILALL